MPERTPEERERDRLEREARRAKKEGRAAPTPDPPNVGDPTAGGGKPDVRPGLEPAPAPAPPPAPPATGRAWRSAAGEPEPDPPLVRRVAPGTPREPVEHPHDQPLPEPAATEPPGRRIPPPPPIEAKDRAIGTRRVAAGHRLGRPHLPHRRHKGAGAPPGAGGDRVWRRRGGALGALAVLAVVLWFAASLFQPFAGDGAGSVTVTIPEGSSVSDVGDLLAANEVVSSGFFFGLRARLEGKDDQLNSGRIELKRDMSYAAALDALTRPAAPTAKVTSFTIPEGLSREEIADRVRETGIDGDYLEATRSVKGFNPRRYGAPADAPLEGFLFPATYELKANQGVENLVKQQLAAFRQNMASVDLRKARRKNLTPYDVLIIASMIDREVQVARERRLVAAVIYNRLADGMALGIDATLRYELKNWTDPLKLSELEADTPYNTRVNTGLPPTPIGNPGLASIEAAANPANVDYLYYVVKPCGDGAHNFGSTAAEHDANVAAYDAKREELGGKSPVTC